MFINPDPYMGIADYYVFLLAYFGCYFLLKKHIRVNKDSKIVYNTHPIVPSSTNVAYPSVDSITNSLKENFNHVLPIDATKLAMEAGNILSLNMVLLGAVTADDKFPLSKDTVIDAMKNNLHKKFHDLNLKAIESGYKSIKG